MASSATVKQPELVVDLETVPKTTPSQALAELPSMFERLAADPKVDVAKLERLIEMYRGLMKDRAKADFDAAFSEMQGEIPIITKDGAIEVDGKVRSKYATNENIQETVKPILQKHGFSLRFRNEQIDGGKLMRIVGILSHRAGHSEQDEFITLPDSGGKMNDIQRIGSSRSYGQRYTTCALLNIATRGADDDGRRAGAKQPVGDLPAGYDEWLTDLSVIAESGTPKLMAAFNRAAKDYRKLLTGTDTWDALKSKAAKVPA